MSRTVGFVTTVDSGGCSALLALLLGNRFVVAGVGDCRVLLLEGDGKARRNMLKGG